MKCKESKRRLNLVAGGAMLIVCAACLCIYAVLAPAGPRYVAGERTRTASELAQLLEKAGPDSALGEYAASLRSQAFAARRSRMFALIPVAFVFAGLGAILIGKTRRPGAQSLRTEASVTEMEESRMPIGVAILGWLGIVVGIFVGASLLTVARDPALRMSFVSASVRVLTGVLYPLVLGYGLLKRREWAITLYQFVYPAVLLIGLVVVLFRTIGHQDLYQPRSDWMPILRYIGMAIPKLAAWGAIVYYLTRPRVLRCFR